MRFPKTTIIAIIPISVSAEKIVPKGKIARFSTERICTACYYVSSVRSLFNKITHTNPHIPISSVGLVLYLVAV